MKKRSGILALVVSIGLFVQPLSGSSLSRFLDDIVKGAMILFAVHVVAHGLEVGTYMGLKGLQMGIEGVHRGVESVGGPVAVLTYAGVAAGMATVYTMISNNVAASNDANKKLLQEAVNYATDRSKLILSEFPEKIEDRIDTLLDQRLVDGDKFIHIFPTPQSRIFVLQNIEDFFVLRKQSQSYRNLSQFVHEVCMNKINDLKLAETRMDNVAQIAAQEIDNVRQQYMNKYGISVATLNNMSSEHIEEKIKDVQHDINSVVLGAINNNEVFDKAKNIQFSALISILAHLCYKQSENKTPMFEGEERISKLKQTRASKKGLEYNEEEFTPEAQQRTAEEKKAALAKQYVGMKLLSKQEGIAKRQQKATAKGYMPQQFTEEELAEQQQRSQQQPVQQSLWSRVKSWFGW